MAKLEKPITITIRTVEEALCAYHRMNVGIGDDDKISPVAKWQLWLMRCEPMGVWVQMRYALASADIDPNKQPPAPLLIGNHEVEALPDGAIKVGFTTVDRATVEKVYAMSNDSMVKAEPEWPRWFNRLVSGNCLLWFESKHQHGSWWCECHVNTHCRTWEIEDAIADPLLIPVTAAQAAAILKGAK